MFGDVSIQINLTVKSSSLHYKTQDIKKIKVDAYTGVKKSEKLGSQVTTFLKCGCPKVVWRCSLFPGFSMCLHTPRYRCAHNIDGSKHMFTWASSENPLWRFSYKTTTAVLEGLPRKVAMVFAIGILDFAKEASLPIVPYLLSNALPFLQSAGMLPCEMVASLSEAQAQSLNSFPKFRERPTKDPQKVA